MDNVNDLASAVPQRFLSQHFASLNSGLVYRYHGAFAQGQVALGAQKL